MTLLTNDTHDNHLAESTCILSNRTKKERLKTINPREALVKYENILIFATNFEGFEMSINPCRNE